MERSRGLKIEACRDASAVGGTAERGCSIVDAAPAIFQIDAFPVRLVGDHQRARDIGVEFRLVPPGKIPGFQADGISLAAERAAVAGNVMKIR